MNMKKKLPCRFGNYDDVFEQGMDGIDYPCFFAETAEDGFLVYDAEGSGVCLCDNAGIAKVLCDFLNSKHETSEQDK